VKTTRPRLPTDLDGMRQIMIWLGTAAAALLPGVALAHTGVGVAGGFLSGFTHPIFGFDHVVAMVAVGLWGAFLGQPSIWLLPVVFPVVMAFGGLAGVLGMPLPGVEVGIALSAVALGAMVALALRPPLWVAAILVGAFAIFHGHAHGTELPEAANPLAYGVGFVIATGLLHLSGIALGLLSRWPAGLGAVRVGGGLIACVGLYFLAGTLTGT
jgi:urease accessory protein